MKIKKTTLIILSLLWMLKGEGALGEELQDVLRAIGENNKELRMNQYQSTLIRSQYAAANALPDPRLSYTHQYGNRNELGINGELIVSQSFDFPTLYAGRSKLARSKAQSLGFRQAELRRQILLDAQEVCLDLVLLRKQQALLEERLANAVELQKLYARRLETGDANLLETNKISLELLNVSTQVRRNASAIATRQRELEILNGGIPIDFTADSYEPTDELPPFDELYDEALALDPALQALRSEQALAGQALRLSRAQYLPGLEAGYQLNTAARGERFNGFLIGVSIPLFSNRHKVRQARAELLYADLRYEDSAVRTKSELLRLHQRSLSLKESIAEYERLLGEQSKLPLLNKALESGGISMIEYFVEINSFYDSLDSYMQLENEYRKNLARLLKHRL